MDDPLNLMRVMPPKEGPEPDRQLSHAIFHAIGKCLPQMNTDFHGLRPGEIQSSVFDPCKSVAQI